MAEAGYSVGRGKPPLHTRFQKGQSGNPSGKPGPAKLAKERFSRALLEALEGDPDDLERRAGEGGIARMARRMVQDAIDGRTAAQRLVLSLLDKAHAEQVEATLPSLDDVLWPEGLGEDAEELSPLLAKRSDAELNSLLQGIKQGNINSLTRKTFPPMARSAPAPRAGTPEGKRPDRFSLVQGKKQGKKFPGADIPPAACPTGSVFEPPRLAGNKQDPFSLVQGKKQGNEKNPPLRAELLGGAATVRPAGNAHIATRPPR